MKGEVGIGKYTKGEARNDEDSNKGEEGTESRLPIKIQNLVYTKLKLTHTHILITCTIV